jgi:hypothetical protein
MYQNVEIQLVNGEKVRTELAVYPDDHGGLQNAIAATVAHGVWQGKSVYYPPGAILSVSLIPK